MGQLSTSGAFLKLFYSDEVSGQDRFCLWTLHNKRHYWFESIDKAEDFVSQNLERDMYFSVALYPKGCTHRKKDSVSCIFGTWLDVDCGEKENGKNYFPTIQEAVDWVYDALAGHWSVIVNSGRGIHVYLLFDEPLWVNDQPSRIQAERAVKAYHSWASSQTKYHLDHVTDLSRIMRLPGTRNGKNGQISHIIDACETRIAASELIDELPEVDITEEVATSIIVGDADQENVKQRIALMCQVDQTFSDTWNRKRRFKDNSPSGYCMSLANQLAAAGLTDPEIVMALQLWRTKELDADPKPKEWYATTIAKARAARADDVAETKFDNALSQALIDTDDEMKATAAQEVFGAELTRIVKVMPPPHKGHTDSVWYRLEFPRGIIKVPNTEALMSQTYMRSRLFEDLGILMRRMKPAQYDKMLNILLSLMTIEHEEAETNTAFNLEQELRMYVYSKIEQCQVVTSISAFNRNTLLRNEEDDKLYFSWQGFKIRLAGVGLKPTNRDLAGILTKIGCHAENFGALRLWSVPEDFNA